MNMVFINVYIVLKRKYNVRWYNQNSSFKLDSKKKTIAIRNASGSSLVYYTPKEGKIALDLLLSTFTCLDQILVKYLDIYSANLCRKHQFWLFQIKKNKPCECSGNIHQDMSIHFPKLHLS